MNEKRPFAGVELSPEAKQRASGIAQAMGVIAACFPVAVTLMPSAMTLTKGRNAMLIHFDTSRAPNKGKPFWIELGTLGFIHLTLLVVIGERVTYTVDAWRPAIDLLPEDEPVLAGFLPLPES